jgi:hypothetical protein
LAPAPILRARRRLIKETDMQGFFPRSLLLQLAWAANLAANLTVSLVASAGEGRCAHCGRPADCRKVCRLVCEEKKVDIVCWGCKAEDFCVPGHCERGCRHCEEVCASCDEAGNPGRIAVKPKKFVWTDWLPGAAKVHTRKKLMRKVETRKISSHRWVVEELCGPCEAKCAAETPTGADLSRVPPVK